MIKITILKNNPIAKLKKWITHYLLEECERIWILSISCYKNVTLKENHLKKKSQTEIKMFVPFPLEDRVRDTDDPCAAAHWPYRFSLTTRKPFVCSRKAYEKAAHDIRWFVVPLEAKQSCRLGLTWLIFLLILSSGNAYKWSNVISKIISFILLNFKQNDKWLIITPGRLKVRSRLLMLRILNHIKYSELTAKNLTVLDHFWFWNPVCDLEGRWSVFKAAVDEDH